MNFTCLSHGLFLNILFSLPPKVTQYKFRKTVTPYILLYISHKLLKTRKDRNYERTIIGNSFK
ncbi:unnamed protein product [Brugia timori]|uniref:Uncharacterized protein n=1 Tax=Brugia timori TaxID=42155 RepID=A0A3P7XUJ2_9BILA|nr:unnamed protein product [Brugia timori]